MSECWHYIRFGTISNGIITGMDCNWNFHPWHEQSNDAAIQTMGSFIDPSNVNPSSKTRYASESQLLLPRVVSTTEKIKVQRLQPSIPSVSQGSSCGITLFCNYANQPHKTFLKRTLLS